MNNFLKRDFDLNAILTVTTRVRVTASPMDMDGGFRDLVGYVAGDPDISNIGWRMMVESARMTILRQHPLLADVKFPDVNGIGRAKRLNIAKKWRSEQRRRFGKTLSVSPSAIPLALFAEEQIDFMKDKYPNIESIEVELDEPGIPKRRNRPPKLRGRNL
jgi:hypothetical protein